MQMEMKKIKIIRILDKKVTVFYSWHYFCEGFFALLTVSLSLFLRLSRDLAFKGQDRVFFFILADSDALFYWCTTVF